MSKIYSRYGLKNMEWMANVPRIIDGNNSYTTAEERGRAYQEYYTKLCQQEELEKSLSPEIKDQPNR